MFSIIRNSDQRKLSCVFISNEGILYNAQQTLMSSQQFNSKGYNYGFVEFDDPGAAERAMQTLNGRRIHQSVSF